MRIKQSRLAVLRCVRKLARSNSYQRLVVHRGAQPRISLVLTVAFDTGSDVCVECRGLTLQQCGLVRVAGNAASCRNSFVSDVAS